MSINGGLSNCLKLYVSISDFSLTPYDHSVMFHQSSDNVSAFNDRHKRLTIKLLKQGYRYTL